MNTEYQHIVAALNNLTLSELVAVMEHITTHLKSHTAESMAEHDDVDDTTRRYLPRLPQMIEWGLAIPLDDTLYIRDQPENPALLLDASRVAYHGQTMGINDWAKLITGWKAVNIYEWVVVKRSGRTLDDLRREYINEYDIE